MKLLIFAGVLTIGPVSMSAYAEEPFNTLQAPSAVLDLTDQETMKDVKKFAVRRDSGSAWLLTGIPRLDPTTGVYSYMALSEVNPTVARQSSVADKLFPGNNRRPVTWEEAQTACRSLGLKNKTWSLPQRQDMVQLNAVLNFGEQVLEPEEGEVKEISTNFRALRSSLPEQFAFFWMAEEGSAAPGLKPAGFFHKEQGKTQLMSQHRLLNIVCVTWMSGPASPQTVTAHQMAEQYEKEKDKGH